MIKRLMVSSLFMTVSTVWAMETTTEEDILNLLKQIDEEQILLINAQGTSSRTELLSQANINEKKTRKARPRASTTLEIQDIDVLLQQLNADLDREKMGLQTEEVRQVDLLFADSFQSESENDLFFYKQRDDLTKAESQAGILFSFKQETSQQLRKVPQSSCTSTSCTSTRSLNLEPKQVQKEEPMQEMDLQEWDASFLAEVASLQESKASKVLPQLPYTEAELINLKQELGAEETQDMDYSPKNAVQEKEQQQQEPQVIKVRTANAQYTLTPDEQEKFVKKAAFFAATKYLLIEYNPVDNIPLVNVAQKNFDTYMKRLERQHDYDRVETVQLFTTQKYEYIKTSISDLVVAAGILQIFEPNICIWLATHTNS